MAGIVKKIEETFHIGGGNKEEEHKGKGSSDHKSDEHKKTDKPHGDASGEHKKEGFVEKIKDKIHGEGGNENKDDKEKKKKKKDKKKHEDGHDDHGHSSSSDSD